MQLLDNTCGVEALGVNIGGENLIGAGVSLYRVLNKQKYFQVCGVFCTVVLVTSGHVA